MVLTNMLPAQGNGEADDFYVYAKDPEGRTTLLGTRRLTCDNAHATKPFGTIDTPSQGGFASGASFVNFGWALTPPPKIIPLNGSTISVLVDGAPSGRWTTTTSVRTSRRCSPAREHGGDDGAIGFLVMDTTSLTNGLHTIRGASATTRARRRVSAAGSSRVSNDPSSLVANQGVGEYAGWTAPPQSPQRVASLPADTTSLNVRLGWALHAAYRSHDVDADGRTLINSEEVNRVEIAFERLGERYSGYLRAGDDLAPLPIGSHLDAATGAFTWAPGVGFVGNYDFGVVRSAGGKHVARHEVRVTLHPKRTRANGSQVVIDTPALQHDVAQPFVLAGLGGGHGCRRRYWHWDASRMGLSVGWRAPGVFGCLRLWRRASGCRGGLRRSVWAIWFRPHGKGFAPG